MKQPRPQSPTGAIAAGPKVAVITLMICAPSVPMRVFVYVVGVGVTLLATAPSHEHGRAFPNQSLQSYAAVVAFAVVPLPLVAVGYAVICCPRGSVGFGPAVPAVPNCTAFKPAFRKAEFDGLRISELNNLSFDIP
jgi:hypothetical protein